MSSHRMSASGDRPFTLNAGGGVATGMQVPSKADDEISISLGQVTEITIPLSHGARIERRIYDANDRGNSTPLEASVLVIQFESPSSQNVHAKGQPGGGLPMSNVDVRKRHENASKDVAWPGWGDYAVLSVEPVPRFLMGSEILLRDVPEDAVRTTQLTEDALAGELAAHPGATKLFVQNTNGELIAKRILLSQRPGQEGVPAEIQKAAGSLPIVVVDGLPEDGWAVV